LRQQARSRTGADFPRAFHLASFILGLVTRRWREGIVLAGAMILVAQSIRPVPAARPRQARGLAAGLPGRRALRAGGCGADALPAQVAGARRTRNTPRPADAPSPATQSLWRYLVRHLRLQLGFFAGSIFGTFGFACIAAWAPIIAQRYYHQSPVEGGAWLGAIAFVTSSSASPGPTEWTCGDASRPIALRSAARIGSRIIVGDPQC
jgi:hypothetical protein